MLLCPVRQCQLGLERQPAQWRCPRGHAFDIARAGYVNLLQPQDRRSRTPGDSPEAVLGRVCLHQTGATRPLFEGLAACLNVGPGQHLLDAGCGDGFYSGTLAQRTGVATHGVDISTPAIEVAQRSYPSCEWVIANADRLIPYATGSFSAVLSITARRNPKEFHRVLEPNGTLLIAIPAPDDLKELRGPGTRDRVPAVIEEFQELFHLESQTRVTTASELSAESVRGILVSVYRPLQAAEPSAMQITLSLDALVFRARELKRNSPSNHQLHGAPLWKR